MRGALDVAIVTARPHPGAVLRGDWHLEDAADHDAVLQHVVVVIAPFAGRARGRCALRISGVAIVARSTATAS
jgi:hypothetical protein